MRSQRGRSQVMIGRDRELRQLTQLAQSRTAQVAFLAGEPGIGKTRLVRELVGFGREGGIAGTLGPATRVLVGHAEPDSLARPYELLLGALDARGRAGGPDAAPPGSAELAALTDAGRSGVERLQAALAIVAAVVGDEPAVIVFEDLHWVDAESAALFERLAEQAGPQLLIGTYRPDEVTSRHPLAALLPRMERRHDVTHLRLERLGLADTAALLATVTGGPVPYRTAAALHHRTGGNPFFLEELLRGYDGDLAALSDQPLPWSLAEVLWRQVDDLDPAGKQVVEAAAVLGHRVPFDLLATVTAVAEDELIAVLRMLVTRGVLVESAEDEFSFRHALVREALTGRMLGRQRRRLHQAALEALLTSGEADPALLAHHAQAAGRYEEMVAAARRGTAHYLSVGSAYQALRLAEQGLAEAGDDPELLAGAAEAATLAGLLADAVGYARRWRDGAERATDRADALALLIRLAWDADDFPQMAVLTQELEQLIPQLPTAAGARAMAAIAQSAMLRDDVDAGVKWADRVLELAEEVPDLDPAVRLGALVEKGWALADRPETVGLGHTILADAVGEAEKVGAWVLAATALHGLVWSPPPDATLAEQAELLERMRVNAEQAGFEALAVAAYLEGRARLAVREGDLGAALAALEQSWSRERGYQPRAPRISYQGFFLAGLCLEVGDLARTEEIIAALRERPGVEPRMVLGLAFHLACRQRRVAQAEQLVDELGQQLAGQAWRNGSQTHDLVSAALHAGLPLPRIRELVAAALPPEVAEHQWRRLIEAQLAEAAGETAVARAGYRALPESTLPLAVRGTLHTGLARCLMALGRDTEAVVEAETAATLLARWGGWRVAQLAQVQAELGLASDPPAADLAALTAREREVAWLISDGLTNAELARRLYISPRTAAVHVRNILRKLGLSSRTEVTSVMGRR